MRLRLIYYSDSVHNIPQPSERRTLLNVHFHLHRLRSKRIDVQLHLQRYLRIFDR